MVILLPESVVRIEVTPKSGEDLRDVRGQFIQNQLLENNNLEFEEVRSIVGYLVLSDIAAEDIKSRAGDIFVDPIIEDFCVDEVMIGKEEIFSKTPDIAISIGFKPGVTDNPGKAALDGFQTVFPDVSKNSKISTYITYLFYGPKQNTDTIQLSKALHNDLIEKAVIQENNFSEHALQFPLPPPQEFQPPKSINLNKSDDELIKISEQGLLALNLEEMKTIQAHYQDHEIQSIRIQHNISPDAPTDVELECLAQTWSEHCKHKIFAAKIHHLDQETGEKITIDSLFKTHIMQPTLDMQENTDWLLSVFHDNSGVIAWDDDWSVCMKVETHNSPSALDPYGGAMTGIVGVNRDILGTGLGARPIANTDVFCFGPPDWDKPLPENLFHPSRVLRGVHAGVRVGGNESGIPTVNGAIVFDSRFVGKPLVYCGTVGLMPRTLPDGRPSHVKTPTTGDLVYMVGGRVGFDGIHGATFSSLELTEESPSSAVQIGDPITQKKLLDMVLEARDSGLISCITDNGAGGLSSSIGEMAEYTNGCHINLDKVPLKQPGLSAWEILVSESQERMTISVKPEHASSFEALAELHEVEVSHVADFTEDGIFHVTHMGKTVAYLPLSFLHDGVPQLQLESEWRKPEHEPFNPPNSIDHSSLLLEMLRRPNIASKESLVRQYDHEVIAQTAIKPFVGPNRDGPGDAAVIAPIHGNSKGLVISCGLSPRYSDIDAGAMAVAAVDEAVRNAVCVGVDLEKIAGLDNFCWPDPIQSQKTPDGRFKLAQLVRANQELERMCRAYHLPCVSGKDSMKNDYGKGEEKISIPPTLLFSLFGNHPDVRMAATSDLKHEGERLYLFGHSSQELGASEVAFHLFEKGEVSGIGGSVPRLENATDKFEQYQKLSQAIQKGLVRTAHDCSEGGLGVAIAEMCIAGRRGAVIDLDGLGDGDTWGRLWGESLGRIVIGVSPHHENELMDFLEGCDVHLLGIVRGDNLEVIDGIDDLLDCNISQLTEAWQGTFGGGEMYE